MKKLKFLTFVGLFAMDQIYHGTSLKDVRKYFGDVNNTLPSFQKLGEMVRLGTGMLFRGVYAQSSTSVPAIKQSSSINYSVHNPLGLTVTPAYTSTGLYTFAVTGLPTELNPDSSANWDIKRVKVRAMCHTASRYISYVLWSVSTTTLTVTIQVTDGATPTAANGVDFTLEVSYE